MKGTVRMKSFSLAIVITTMMLFIVASPPALALPWAQFQKDEMNTGKTTDFAPLKATKAWKVFTHTDDWGMAGIDVVPIVADGKVFAIDAKGYVWALDAKNGDVLWEKALSCEGYQFQLATPAYGEGKVFFATNDGYVYALDPQDGTIIWYNRIASTYDQLNTPITYADGKLYIGSYESDNGANETGIYYCLDASSGNILWKRPAKTGKGYYWSGACVIGDYIVYGDLASVLTSVYKDNGTEVDQLDITKGGRIGFNRSDAGSIRSSITYNNSFIFFTSEGGYIWKVGFDEDTGKFTSEGWSQVIGYSCSTPVVHDGRIYVGTGTFSTPGKLYCLREDSGEEIWNLSVEGGIKASPAISIQDGKPYIYFSTNCENGSVYCVDSDGKEIWSFTTEEAGTSGGYILQGVAISDGYVYFGNDGGYVYALGPIMWEGEVTLTENTTFTITAHNSGKSYEVSRTSALGALDAAAEKGAFNYTVSDEWYASYGSFLIDSIADVENTASEYWLYWVNYPDEPMPMVGANQYELKDGDIVTYYYGGWTATPENAALIIRIHVHIRPSYVTFDTGQPSNPYPSIFGIHYGTITPSKTIIATKLYTYPCEGTGGHTEYARIWNATWEAIATWSGYEGDWHNITFNKPVILMANETYFYEIHTGSYPQIHHTSSLLTANGWINCSQFVDANGRTYDDWIPAIRLF
ncbi:MAG: outer membrane protein assembly factor BamB family protein [Candidatus Methanospirareceae archaeon]